MSLSSRLNAFVENRVGIRSYPAKVVLLFSFIVFLSMLFAFIVDVAYSFREIERDIEKASERAAKFRTTAIGNVVLSILHVDFAFLKLMEKKGEDALLPLVGSFLSCFWNGKEVFGSVERPLLERALGDSAEKDVFFYLHPERWIGISILKKGGRTYAFCHKLPYLDNILSKELGAIAKYGAEFYLGRKPEVREGDILVSFTGIYGGTNMYVRVRSADILRTLVKERVLVYVRTYIVFILFLGVSYLVWASLISYPIRRLRKVVRELDAGNYEVELEDLLKAKDEFGSTARLLAAYSEDVKKRFERLELIMETAMSSVSSPEEVSEFIKRTLDKLRSAFGFRASLFIIDEVSLDRLLVVVPSAYTSPEDREELIAFYKSKKDREEPNGEEPVCYKEGLGDGCKSLFLFKLDEDTVGAFIFWLKRDLDRIGEGYLRVVCQHMVGTIKLSHMAFTDPLTGIPNRRKLEKDLKDYVDGTMSLVMIDIDNFKGINDAYGHKVGDEVLKRLAKLLKESVGVRCTVYRYGGEEFAIICKDTEKAVAYELAEDIRRRIRSGPINGIYVTVSLGVASYPEDARDMEELLIVADVSLYKAKREGKNRTAVLLGKGDRDSLLRGFKKEKELIQLLRSGSFTYHLQPIYDIQKNVVFGYELLFRLVDGDRRIPMGMFVNEIQDATLIESIDVESLKRAVELLKRDEHYRYAFFINVSPRSLERGELLSELRKVPKYFRPRIYIEITEREAFINADEARKRVEELKSMGYRVVMDDFGSGFSSLSSMRMFIKFLDLIKVDGAFVKGVSVDPYNRAILESLKFMTDKFSIDLVAEHVDDPRDLKRLKGMGIRFGQGFYFSDHKRKSSPR